MPRNPQIHFRLKPKDNDGKCLIYLQFLYNRNRLFFSFGYRISRKNWNGPKQRIKNNKETFDDGTHDFNETLDTLKKICEKAYNKERKNGIPKPAMLKKYLHDFIYKNDAVADGHTLYKLIQRFVEGEIKFKGRDKCANTIKTYKTTLNHLKEFERQKKYPINFDSISLDFFYKFVSMLRAKGLSQNSIGKDIRILKVFMAEAIDLGYTNNAQFMHKKFSVDNVDTDAVYLSYKELNTLYNLDLTKNKKLEQVRDLFVFGSFVGLRFSDYSNIRPENITEIDGDSFIKMITQKTGEPVIIPCNHIVLDIFKKYENNSNRLPKALSNQKFNQYIKEIAILAKFTELGRLGTAPERPLNECISSHTARRSFATNLFLDGYPTIEIMKITGHRTEKAFMNYIRSFET